MSEQNVEITRRAHEAYERGDWAELDKDFDSEAIAYREVPDGAIFDAPGLLRAPIEAEFWFVHTLRDGRVNRLGVFGSRARALKAAGLSE